MNRRNAVRLGKIENNSPPPLARPDCCHIGSTGNSRNDERSAFRLVCPESKIAGFDPITANLVLNPQPNPDPDSLGRGQTRKVQCNGVRPVAVRQPDGIKSHVALLRVKPTHHHANDGSRRDVSL